MVLDSDHSYTHCIHFLGILKLPESQVQYLYT